ncbi:MAG: hypothetical protein ACKVQU_29790, partial [Burkholderiales bacterium]
MNDRSLPPEIELDRFLDFLVAEKYRIGVRERLLAHSLVADDAATGRLAERRGEPLLRLQPLLSRDKDEQSRFKKVVEQFRLGRIPSDGAAPGPVDYQRSAALPLVAQVGWTLALIGLVVGTVLAVYWYAPRPKLEVPTKIAAPTAEAPAGAGAIISAGDTRALYVPALPFKIPEAPVASPAVAWTLPRIAIVGLGGVAFLGFAAWLVAQRLRKRYLQQLRTNEEVDERIFHDKTGSTIVLAPTLARPVSRMLRQRSAGLRSDLDLPATVRETVKRAGAFTPRFRLRSQTPEYVALVERVAQADHQAAFHQALVHALKEQGVAIDLFYFDGSPAFGCWPETKVKDGWLQRDKISIDDLSARYEGHRLLVFGGAQAAFVSATNAPARWARSLNLFPLRAWFSPHPVQSWGEHEARIDELGFLVLPSHPEALHTLAEWLSSDRAALQLDPSWPALYPALLRDDALNWGARRIAPPDDVVEELCYQLRAYLGPVRYQWLAGCAIFPAVSWPLTLSLGAEFERNDAELVRGAAALGALPWFRYAYMPGWLRAVLVRTLPLEQDRALRERIEKRLTEVVVGGAGDEVLSASTRRKLNAWVSRARGLARDVVFVDFLQRGVATRLAQRLPEAIRRQLWERGHPGYSLRGWIPATLAALILPGLIALTPAGDVIQGRF